MIAIVDPLDCIDEINDSKSDNEMRKEIKMNYPDLTVTEFISPSREDRNASVVIANMGVKNASNVTVRFEVSEVRRKEKWRWRGMGCIPHKTGAAKYTCSFQVA
nr:hypothetical protein [Methanophagales archaeon]